MKRKTRAKTQPKIRAKLRAKTKPTKPRSLPVRQTAGQANEAQSIEALVAASARALGIKIDPSWEVGVKFNLQLILRHAALVDGFALPDDAEPASIFHA